MDLQSEEYRKKLELDILKVIEEGLMAGQMDAQRAQNIAKMILVSLKPHLTIEQIHKIAPSLDDHYKELTKAILPVLKDHEEHLKRIVTEHALKLIKEERFEEAKNILTRANKPIENQNGS